jgi:hypothetical protein
MLQEPLDCGSGTVLAFSVPMRILNLIPPSLVLTLCTIGVNNKKIVHPVHRVHVFFCVIYGSQNKQLLLPDATLTDGFLFPRRSVLIGRFELYLSV